MGFARHNPHLFHVTHRTALPSIRAHGLLPTATLANGPSTTENRETWTPAPAPDGSTAWLRWQNMPETPIAARLDPAIPPAAWRLFINSMVFLFASEADARRLAASPRDADRDQITLRFETAALLEAGCALLTCRWNNGYLDRSPATARRLRRYDDYRPAALWHRGENLGEITAFGGIPAGIPFETLP